VALHDDLLDQAEHLARKEPKRPKQASLRRVVSSAYYALFHLLVDEAVMGLVRGPPYELRPVLRRAFDHSEMKTMSKAFAGGTLPASLATVLAAPVPPGIQLVAETFVDLQQARHEADYDLSRNFSRAEVNDLIERTRAAFDRWRAVKGSDAARLYLVALLVGEKLRKRGS